MHNYTTPISPLDVGETKLSKLHLNVTDCTPLMQSLDSSATPNAINQTCTKANRKSEIQEFNLSNHEKDNQAATAIAAERNLQYQSPAPPKNILGKSKMKIEIDLRKD